MCLLTFRSALRTLWICGFILSVTILNGLGGIPLWKEHAVKTAAALSRMKPHFIGSLVFMPDDYSPMYCDVAEGRFVLMTPSELAAETLLMLENIDSEGSVFRSNHASNYLVLRGVLNRDRESMIEKLRFTLGGNAKFRPDFMRGL